MTAKEKIPPGYKPSPLGPIPRDWDLIEFGDFAEVEKGKYIPVEHEKIQCLELEHFEQGTGHILGWIDSSEQKSTKNKFEKGQVLFGKLRPYLQKYWLAEFDGVCSSEVWVLNSKNKKCSNDFLFRLIQHNHFIQVANVSSGSKMPRADWNYVSSFPFPLPPLPEQTAIANLLSTWDKAIQTTTALITQKQNRKKWLMQKLLTGKKRLKGFKEKWTKIDLEKYFIFIKSYSISRDGLFHSNSHNSIHCIHYGDIHSFYEGEFLDFSKQQNIPQIIAAKQIVNKKDYLKDGDVIIADASEDYEGVGEAVEVVNIKNKQAVGGLHTIVLRDIKNATAPRFRAYLFASEVVRNELRKKATGTSVYSVTKTTLQTLILNIPPIEEQTAIANVLQAADKEIQTLQSKLDKVKEQKKGLMQVLLTGKKRLKIK